MKLQNLATNAQNPGESINRLDVREEKAKNRPPLAEIRQRASEIHIECGGIHGCDLDDWLQAERELQEKHNENNGAGPKNK